MKNRSLKNTKKYQACVVFQVTKKENKKYLFTGMNSTLPCSSSSTGKQAFLLLVVSRITAIPGNTSIPMVIPVYTLICNLNYVEKRHEYIILM